MTERRKTNEVRDYPVELWIKVLGLVAAITVPMIGGFGTLIVKSLNDINNGIDKLQESVAALMISGKVTETKLEATDKRTLSNKNYIESVDKRVYSLEGKFQSWKK